jgi:hypothetical protein
VSKCAEEMNGCVFPTALHSRQSKSVLHRMCPDIARSPRVLRHIWRPCGLRPVGPEILGSLWTDLETDRPHSNIDSRTGQKERVSVSRTADKRSREGELTKRIHYLES